MIDVVVFVENHLYTFIYYTSLMFGTCRMTIASKTHKIVSYATSLIWCLVIISNQVDYIMKPWVEERKEMRKQDVTFEKIIRLDFWTYNAIYLLSCSLPLFGRKIELNTNALQMSRSTTTDTIVLTRKLSRSDISTNTLTRDIWRIVIVFIFIVGNLTPAIFSYNISSIQKKTDSTYNLLLQDLCKLGILTVDLQFVWFCWSLEDGFSKLNECLLTVVSFETPVTAKARRTQTVVVHTRNDNYKYEIHRFDFAYRTLTDGVKFVNGVCQERILANVLCYMFNTICGLFNTISAYRTQGTVPAIVVIHLLWVANCAGRLTLVCFAASSVVDQDDRLHDSAYVVREAFTDDYLEMKRFLGRLTYCKVKFEVCGMITIDKTLLSSAVISVISYLVIVLQYNYS